MDNKPGMNEDRWCGPLRKRVVVELLSSACFMTRLAKKILVILPVIILNFLYLKAHNNDYRHLGSKRLMLLILTLVLLYGVILISVILWRQRTVFRMCVQSSFLVYIFMVLTLTGYFILFREISTHGWWTNMQWRIQHKDHVNLIPFQVFKIYEVTDKQILGNFIMLLPMGIFLPILFRKMDNLLLVFLAALMTSTLIEFLQLATKFRSADVDDIILNTAGAVLGFLFYRMSASFKPRAALDT
jgi:glycopeptide antibiotics resistance protein